MGFSTRSFTNPSSAKSERRIHDFDFVLGFQQNKIDDPDLEDALGTAVIPRMPPTSSWTQPSPPRNLLMSMMPFHTGFGPSVRCKIQPPLDIKILSLATTKDKGRDFKEVALPSPTLDKSIFASRNVKKLCSGDSLADLNSFFQKCLANRISTHYQLQITTVSTLPSQRDRVQKTPIA